jgi:hypothetical protein
VKDYALTPSPMFGEGRGGVRRYRALPTFIKRVVLFHFMKISALF